MHIQLFKHSTASLGLLDCKKLELLSVNCTTVRYMPEKEQISEQSRWDKSCINKDIKMNTFTVQNK